MASANATRPPTSSIDVVSAQPEHLSGIVECHMVAFPDELSTRLGRGYVRGLYRHFMEHPEGICLVAVEAKTGRVGGVVIGGRPDLRDRYVRRRIPYVFACLVCRMFTSKYVWWRLFAAARSALQKDRKVAGPQQRPASPQPGNWARLRVICTHPDFQRRGIGKMLMSAFRAACIRRGYEAVRLRVSRDNPAAAALYRSDGWESVGKDDMFLRFCRKL